MPALRWQRTTAGRAHCGPKVRHGLLVSGHQLGPLCPAAAAVVAHTLDDLADRHVALRCGRVGLGQHAILPAPVTGDPHEPRREGAERFVERLPARRQRLVAVATPVPTLDRSRGHFTAFTI